MNKLWMGVAVGVVVVSSVLSASWVSAEQYDLRVGQVSATYSNESVGQNSISNKIAELLKQIGELQEKVAKLKSEQIAPSPDSGIQTEAKEEWSGDDDYKFEKDLSFGAKNDKEVEKLQKFLLEKGYYSGPVTGNYLSLTLRAVKKFQKENGVEETGYFGPKTRAALKSKVVSCAVGQDCGGGTIKPIEHVLKIDTKSDLKAWVGKNFSAEFRVNGWNSSHGNLSLEGSGVIPGLSWSKPTIQCIMAPCGDAPMKNSQTIYLSGTPTEAGVYRVAVTASSWSSGCNSTNGICPEMAKQTGYGRAEFTVVVNGTASNNFPPVINGTSGPTTLKVGESGMWEVKALDPESGSLSYSISWGDEILSSQQKSMTALGALDSFSQTASFSHAYSKAGEYKIVFIVKDEAGLKASASISVLVKDEYSEQGSLKIDPSSASIKVGESRQFLAWFNPSANCDGIKCPKGPVRQVEASWSVSGAEGIITVISNSCSNGSSCSPSVTVTGSKAGRADLIATYAAGGKVYTAKASLSVSSVPTPRGTLLIDPSSLKLQKGQSGTLSSFFMSYVPPCSSNTESPCLVAVKNPVDVLWSNSTPGRISLSCLSATTSMSQDKLWQQCSGNQVNVGALSGGGAQVLASYKDSNGQVYTVAAPVTVTDPNPVVGKLIIVPDSFSVGVGGAKTLSLFMEYPSSCPEGVVCTQLAPTPVKGTWSSSNNSVIRLACPPMPPCPAGMACIQVMPTCTGTTMNATGASQGTAKILADYVDGSGRYYLAESLVTVSGVGATSSSAPAGLNSNQQAANILQSLYEALIGMQSRFSR